MKVCRGVALLLTMAVVCSGCGSAGKKLDDTEADIYTKINHKYMDMNGYSAKVRFTVRSNKTENVYECAQTFREPDQYRLEMTAPDSVKGMVSVINGATVEMDAGLGGFVIDTLKNDDGDYLFINRFFENYYKSEETAVAVSGGDVDGKYTVLTTDIIDGDAKTHKMAMMIDNKTLLPYRLTVYDMGGAERIVAEYSDVKINPQIDDRMFKLNE